MTSFTNAPPIDVNIVSGGGGSTTDLMNYITKEITTAVATIESTSTVYAVDTTSTDIVNAGSCTLTISDSVFSANNIFIITDIGGSADLYNIIIKSSNGSILQLKENSSGLSEITLNTKWATLELSPNPYRDGVGNGVITVLSNTNVEDVETNLNVRFITADANIALDDDIIIANVSSGPIALVFLSETSNTNKIYRIKHNGGNPTINPISVTGAGSATIKFDNVELSSRTIINQFNGAVALLSEAGTSIRLYLLDDYNKTLSNASNIGNNVTNIGNNATNIGNNSASIVTNDNDIALLQKGVINSLLFISTTDNQIFLATPDFYHMDVVITHNNVVIRIDARSGNPFYQLLRVNSATLVVRDVEGNANALNTTMNVYNTQGGLVAHFITLNYGSYSTNPVVDNTTGNVLFIDV